MHIIMTDMASIVRNLLYTYHFSLHYFFRMDNKYKMLIINPT